MNEKIKSFIAGICTGLGIWHAFWALWFLWNDFPMNTVYAFMTSAIVLYTFGLWFEFLRDRKPEKPEEKKGYYYEEMEIFKMLARYQPRSPSFLEVFGDVIKFILAAGLIVLTIAFILLFPFVMIHLIVSISTWYLLLLLPYFTVLLFVYGVLTS